MDEKLPDFTVRLNLDDRAFRSAVEATRNELNSLARAAGMPGRSLVEVARAGRREAQELGRIGRTAIDGMNRALERFAQTGRLTFTDLRRIALTVLQDIARQILASLQIPLPRILPPAIPFPFLGGTGGIGQALLGGLISLVGRAQGGPVAPGRPYLVGERGPEVFLPQSAGRIAPVAARSEARALRPLQISITINGADNGAGRMDALAVGRAIRRALAMSEGLA